MEEGKDIGLVVSFGGYNQYNNPTFCIQFYSTYNNSHLWTRTFNTSSQTWNGWTTVY